MGQEAGWNEIFGDSRRLAQFTTKRFSATPDQGRERPPVLCASSLSISGGSKIGEHHPQDTGAIATRVEFLSFCNVGVPHRDDKNPALGIRMSNTHLVIQ